VLDVPAKLAARARVFDTGNARKTDAHDAHAIVMVALRTRGLRQLSVDEGLAVLRLLADRRDELSRSRAQTVNRLHRLLAELVPGGAKRDLSSFKARDLLATVRPRDLPGRTRRQLAVDLVVELETTDRKLKELTKRLRVEVLASGSHLMDIFGVGPAGAARILADVGDVARFPDRAHFASWTGTAPIDASSGEQIRHRLSRPGTGGSITCSTWPASCRSATTPTAGPTTGASSPSPRPRWRRCAAYAEGCPTSSTANSSPTPLPGARARTRRAREDTPGRLCNPARPTYPRTSALRISHFPGPHQSR
jgi:hypothetical protein